jgi:hypothetical protein
MSKRARGRPERSGTPPQQGQEGEAGRTTGSGSFLGQIGLFETGNGLAHGPGVILVAIAMAIVVYPITRLVRFLTRR